MACPRTSQQLLALVCLLLAQTLAIDVIVNRNGALQAIRIERLIGESWFDACLRVASLHDFVTGEGCKEDPYCPAEQFLALIASEVGCTTADPHSADSCTAPLYPALYLIHGGDPSRRRLMSHQFERQVLGPELAAAVVWVDDDWARGRHRQRLP